jgi:hypothetical protein
MVNVIHSRWMGISCAKWHKVIPKSINPKIIFQIKTNGLIQKCSSNHTIKMMMRRKYHVKLNYNLLIQKWWVHALKPHYKLNYNDISMIIHQRKKN